MPNITDFLLGTASGQTFPVAGVWVRLQNNVTLATFVSTAVTDAVGTFTVLNVPAGSYTVATGPTNTGPFTNTTDANYFVGVDVNATLTTFLGSVSIRGTDPWFDVRAYGADPTGATSSTAAFASAFSALTTAGGGVLFIPPGTYSGTLSINANVRCLVLAWGVTLQPSASSDGVFVNQANGPGALGCEIYGLVVDGQSQTGVNGFHARDTDFAVLRKCRIVNCVTGIFLDAHTSGHFVEATGIHDTYLFNCTTGISFSPSAGATSFDETQLVNVGISQCATGIAMNTPASLLRTRFVGVQIWVPTNGVGLLVDCDVRDSVWVVDFENLNGTSTNLTGVSVTTNAANIDLLDTHFGFTNTFTTQVADPTNKGIVWSDGTHRFSLGPGWWNAVKLSGDSFDRVRFGGFFSGGGGIQFGVGSVATDVQLFRLAAGVLTTPGAFARGSQAPAFAASFTPDPTQGELITMTLTNNITVNAPVNGVNKGVVLRFVWTQDGTGGRTITYNAIFHTGGGTALVTTLNTVTIDTFEYDGAAWRLLSRITGQA